MSGGAHDVVIALGSNLGDREQTIRAGIHDLDALEGVTVVAASGLVETPALKPQGVDVDAPAYLNAVVLVHTTLEPLDLLDAVNEIEHEHGRVREVRWGDRTLDLDLIAYEGWEIDTERLTLPHPGAAGRAFVLAPWLQVAPDAELPGRGRVDALLAATGETPADYPAESLL